MTAAADELAVTPAAVSHQVRQLEEYFGVALFRRSVRSIRLTDSGAALLPFLSEGLDRFEQGCHGLATVDMETPLVISSSPVFAGRWLVRRLSLFNAVHPDITVRLDGTLSIANFTSDGVDAAIRFGAGPYPGLYTKALVNEDVVPVCSPDLIENSHPLRTPSDLKHYTLLHVDWMAAAGMQPDWAMWLKAAGASDVDSHKGPVMTSDTLVLEAAINGGGVALIAEFLARSELESGQLIKPFDLVLPSDHWYWFVCPTENLERPKVKAFHDWLVEAIECDEATAGASIPA